VKAGSAALLFVGLFALLLLGGSACPSRSPNSIAPDDWVTIRGARVAVEIADTPEKQALGLGEREDLAWDDGMLFPYDRPEFHAFWMKGMRFSIDIVWILKGRIVDIDANVPFEPDKNGPTLRSPSLVDAVLEVPAGYAAANGWRIGDRVLRASEAETGGSAR
jgi:uncharacterized membrane protein (UPF0127 family)